MATETLQPAAGPRRRWQVGSVDFSLNADGKWGAERAGHGVGGWRTPAGALIALLRWDRGIGRAEKAAAAE